MRSASCTAGCPAHDVLFAADGRPVLTGLGIGALLAPASPAGPPSYPTPPDDVRALGEVLRFALTGGRAGAAVPGPLAPLVASCLAADPDARPSPTRVGTMAWDAAPGVPVLLDALEPAERSAAVVQPSAALPMRSVARPLVVGVGVALGVAALVAGAWAVAPRFSGVRPAPAVPSSAAPADGLDDVQGLVAGLAAGRARAMADRDVPALAAVDAPGSPALAADSAFIARLRAAGVTLRGLRFAVTDAGVVEVSGDAATVQARVATSAYVEVRRGRIGRATGRRRDAEERPAGAAANARRLADHDGRVRDQSRCSVHRAASSRVACRNAYPSASSLRGSSR